MYHHVASSVSRVLGCVLLTALWGCSALVDADKAKLGTNTGGRDAGTMGGLDGGGNGANPVPLCSNGCEDGIACTVDQCVGQACSNTPDNAACKAAERCSPVKGCVPVLCRDSSDCDDGNACNGSEVCDKASPKADAATACVPGTALSCADKIDCTIDSCDPASGCAHKPDAAKCDDGVDCTDDACDAAGGCKNTGNDAKCQFCATNSVCNVNEGCKGGLAKSCSDGDACTTDTCSVAAQACQNTARDADVDGYGADTVADSSCGGGRCFCGEGDCDDTDPAIYPGAIEFCDGADNDCNGAVDDECTDIPDTCADAATLTLSDAGHAQLTGSFATVTSTYNTACGQSGGRDAVYKINVEALSDIVIDSTASPASTVLAVGTACGSQGFAFGCAGALSEAEGGSRLVLHHYDPAVRGKQLFILVDAPTSAETGEYTVDIDVVPAALDSCEADVLDLSACGTVVGFMESRFPPNLWGQQKGTCQPGGVGGVQSAAAPEAMMRIKGNANGKVALVARSDAFAPVLYVRTICGSASQDDELGCESSINGSGNMGRADFSVDLAEGEDAIVIVDNGGDGDKYELRCTP